VTLALAFALIAGAGRGAPLAEGVELLRAFRVEEGLARLEKARTGGPYAHEDFVLLHEQLAIGYAYAGRAAEAQAQFERLLAISPTHSPKVTFVYERARQRARLRAPPTLELTFDRAGVAQRPLALTVALAGAEALARVGLLWRRQGSVDWVRLQAALDHDGVAHFELAPLPTEGSLTRELYAVAYDAAGNEVLQLGSPLAPRELTQRLDVSPRWYQRWYVWLAAAAVVAAAVGTAVYASTRPPPAEVPVSFSTVSF